MIKYTITAYDRETLISALRAIEEYAVTRNELKTGEELLFRHGNKVGLIKKTKSSHSVQVVYDK